MVFSKKPKKQTPPKSSYLEGWHIIYKPRTPMGKKFQQTLSLVFFKP